ncbi:MAG: non-homologous end-joining DNA ligase [Myxococcales bacterium]|nr:non-homologous end-joining DNA ligase [Myxococcales bacterium]
MGKRPGTMIGVGDRMIELTNEQAKMFPKAGLTKGDLAFYYLEVAAVILPHLEDRPLTVERFTSGIGRPGFIQKNAGEHYPEWIRRASVPSKSKPNDVTEHVVCDDAATLVYLANQRCVTLHVAPVRCDQLHRPDQVIFDFDPPDAGEASFAAVRDGALATAELLRECGLTPFVKTSGSKGLHVIAPLLRDADVDEVRAFGKAICDLVASRDPARFTTSMTKQDREGRVFLDYLRNGYAQTVVAPYSVRPLPGAPVSTPITWEELLEPQLHAQTYTLRNVRELLRQRRDPWANIAAHAGSLDAASVSLDVFLGS